MANNIFYAAGCRAALVKMGAAPDDPYYFLKDPEADVTQQVTGRGLLNVLGHGVLGGAVGAGLGALGGAPRDRAPGALIGGALGFNTGVMGKAIANQVRHGQALAAGLPRYDLIKEHLSGIKGGVPDPAKQQAFEEAMATQNAEVQRLRNKERGFWY